MMKIIQRHVYFFLATATASQQPPLGQTALPVSHPMVFVAPKIQTIHVKIVRLGIVARSMGTVVRRATSVAWDVNPYSEAVT